MLVNMKAILLASDLGMMVDRIESAYSVPVVKAVRLMRMRIALMVSTCVSISDIRLCIWSFSCPISCVSTNPHVSRIRSLGGGYAFSPLSKALALTNILLLLTVS